MVVRSMEKCDIQEEVVEVSLLHWKHLGNNTLDMSEYDILDVICEWASAQRLSVDFDLQ